MRTLLALGICCLLSTHFLSAQSTEIGGFFGVTNYLGDLSRDVYEPTQFNVALGVFARQNVTEHWSVKAGMNGGILSGSDQYTNKPARNLNFRTMLIETALQLEYNIVTLPVLDDQHLVSPYVFAGVGGFYFNPYALYRGSMVELQPLGTEGQGLEGYDPYYQRVGLSVPMGGGLKFNINGRSSVGFEFGFRKTFTDYLDDVSGAYPDRSDMIEADRVMGYTLSYRTPEYNIKAPLEAKGLRGNPDNMDAYVFAGVQAAIVLGGNNPKAAAHRRAKGKSSGRLFYSRTPFQGF